MNERKKRDLGVLIAWLILCGGILVVFFLTDEAHAAQPCTTMIAHRGGIYEGMTENGMPAIQRTAGLGVTRFEVDVRTASDNTLWVMHDSTVDKTTNGTGAVTDKTSTQMKALRLDDGTPVPSVKDVIAHAAANGQHLVLHIKGMTATSWQALENRLDDYGWKPNTTILAPVGLIRTAETYMPSIAKTQIWAPGEAISSHVTAVAVVRDFATVVTAANVKSVRSQGLGYWVATPRTQEDWDRLTGWGVTRMFIDNVDDYLGTCS